MGLIITCPVCGDRDGYEFRYGGEHKGPRLPENNMTNAQWCDWVHLNNCRAGIQEEWWCHKDGCGSWFVISRDTTTNRQVSQESVT